MRKSIFLFILLPFIGVISQRIRIPENLIQCYRGNLTDDWFPNSLPMVIDIVRKIEQAFPTSIDLRHLSARLFHDLRIDGIQRSINAVESEDVTAYTVSGFMTNKNRVLRQIISSVSGDFEYENLLTKNELCLLHKLLSSSVEPFEQSNELRTCPWTILNTTSDQSNVRERLPGQFFPNRRSFNNHTIVSPNFSRCPIEKGVVSNNYGAIHPGIIVAAVASGMQPQNVKISDFIAEYHERDPYANLETMEETDNRQKIEKMLSLLSSVDNTYAATLVSDLAEVVLYQGSNLGHNFSIGFPGIWNDTYFPRCHHLNGSRNGYFHMTDSEILSGLDGLFISQQVSSWTTRIRRLRLSQILDMYYLHQGISIPTIQTTNRDNFFGGRTNTVNKKNKGNDENINEEKHSSFDGKTLFRKAFNYKMLNEELSDTNLLSRFSIAEGINSVCHRQKIIEMIDIDKLKDETYNFVQILEIATKTPVVMPSLLRSFSDTAVDKMLNYANKLVSSTTDCTRKPITIKKPRIDMTLIIDGSRDFYGNLQFIHYVADMIGVSRFGSYISVVHGNNGEYLANRTNNIAELFEQLRNSSFNAPFRLSVLNALGGVMHRMSDQLQEEKSSGSYMELSKVILLVSQSHRVSQMDFENSQWLLRTSMLQFPDLYFIFLSNDAATFEEMIYKTSQNPATSARKMIESIERYRFVHAPSIDIQTFEKSLELAVDAIPKRIVSPFCKNVNNKSASYIREEFEDYAIPNVELLYRISPLYIFGSEEIRIRFQGVGYGDLSICMSRHSNLTDKVCETIQDIENVWFNITQPCVNHVSSECLGIYFTVSVETSYVRCTEYTCRFPDDVRFNVRPEGLRCERNSSTSSFTHVQFAVIALASLVLGKLLN